MGTGLLAKLQDAGVRAGREPAHVLLSTPAELMIVDGTDTAPLSRADRELVARYPQDVARGLKLAMQATGARRAVLALAPEAREASGALAREISADGFLKFHVTDLKIASHYPAGGATHLAALATERPVPSGGTPEDVGAHVLSVRTLLAIAEADRGQPQTHQLVSIMGEVNRPVTVWVPYGLPLMRLVAAAGGIRGAAARPLARSRAATADGSTAGTAADFVYLEGGPLGGQAASPDAPLRPDTNLVVVLRADSRAAATHLTPLEVHTRRALSTCENCEQCTAVCPRFLAGWRIEPHRIVRALARALPDEVLVSAALCSGCGVCTVACPAGLAPDILTLAVREQLARAGFEPRIEPARPRSYAADRRLPRERLLLRLDLARYDVAAPLAGTLAADRVVVPLELPWGGKASPVVRDGHRVKAGQPIAQSPAGDLALPVHAPMAGSVRLSPLGVEISA